jgi:hypothetical protein
VQGSQLAVVARIARALDEEPRRRKDATLRLLEAIEELLADRPEND